MQVWDEEDFDTEQYEIDAAHETPQSFQSIIPVDHVYVIKAEVVNKFKTAKLETSPSKITPLK